MSVLTGNVTASGVNLDEEAGLCSDKSATHSSYESFGSCSDESIEPDNTDLEHKVSILEAQLSRLNTHTQSSANPSITPSDFLLPLATTLMFAGSALDEFYWFPELAGWCFVVGGAIFMFYGWQGLGGKLYRKCRGIKRDPLPPI